MTKEQLQKLYNYKLITLVGSIDYVVEKIKDMSDNDAISYLKSCELLNHVIDNESILNLIGVDATTTAVDEGADPKDPIVDPVTDNPEDDTDPEELPVVDEGDE